jgi:hypothetical protein
VAGRPACTRRWDRKEEEEISNHTAVSSNFINTLVSRFLFFGKRPPLLTSADVAAATTIRILIILLYLRKKKVLF